MNGEVELITTTLCGESRYLLRIIEPDTFAFADANHSRRTPGCADRMLRLLDNGSELRVSPTQSVSEPDHTLFRVDGLLLRSGPSPFDADPPPLRARDWELAEIAKLVEHPPEADRIPFEVCPTTIDVDSLGQARVSDIELESLAQDLQNRNDLEHVTGVIGTSLFPGTVAVTMSYRFQPSIDLLTEVASLDQLCLILPEVGAYGEPVRLTWGFVDREEVDSDSTSFLVRASTFNCDKVRPGTLLKPQIDYTDERIIVRISANAEPTLHFLDQSEFSFRRPGSCGDERFLQIQLAEPRNGRPVRGS